MSIRQLWTAKQTAEHLQISIRTLDRWVRQGKIAQVKLGRHNKYRQEDVEALIAGNTNTNLTINLNINKPPTNDAGLFANTLGKVQADK